MDISRFLTIPEKIISSTNYVHSQSQSVIINEEKLKEYVKSTMKEEINHVPSWSSGHIDVNSYDTETIVSFICVIDSLNFCFWPCSIEFEYDNMVKNAVAILKKDPAFFTAERLIRVTPKEVEAIFIENFPLIDERSRSLNELGTMIKNKFDSKFSEFLNKNDNDVNKVTIT